MAHKKFSHQRNAAVIPRSRTIIDRSGDVIDTSTGEVISNIHRQQLARLLTRPVDPTIDRRLFRPFKPVSLPPKTSLRRVLNSIRKFRNIPSRSRTAIFNAVPGYTHARRVVVCTRRKIRREVLYAFGVLDNRHRGAGSGQKKKTRRYTADSVIKCGR